MSDKNPLVSMIVPVYNAQDYLSYCIDSLRSQTYENLEIILVDDGSKDDSGAICDAYAQQDSRIHVIHQENGGISCAQNAGLDAAHGGFIAFADNDDILSCNNIEVLLDALLTTGASMSKARWQQFGVSQLASIQEQASKRLDVNSCSGNPYTFVAEPLRAYQTVFCKSLRLIGELFGRKSEARYCNEANWCRLYRKELWDGLRFPEGKYAQDTALASKLYARMESIADVNVVLYYWLQRPDSVTHRMRDASFYHDHIDAVRANWSVCMEQHVLPARSYYTMMGNLHDELKAIKQAELLSCDASKICYARYSEDVKFMRKAVVQLPWLQRVYCALLRRIRLIEKYIYDRRIKNMK